MRILAFQPHPYDGSEIYWRRDMGALVHAWIALGHDASLVLFEAGGVPPGAGLPLLLTDPIRARDPAWWRAQRPDAVIFNTWGASRYRPIWDAALAVTPRIVDRLDTDGIRSPRVELESYLFSMWSRMKDVTRRRWRSPLAWPYSLAHAAVQGAVPSLLDLKMAAALAHLPAVTAESPIAAARIRRFQQIFGHSGDNVHQVPHPVVEDALPEVRPDARERLITSVGRWDSHQKNLPLLLDVLRDFIRVNPGWRVELVGNLGKQEGFARAAVAGLPIELMGPLPHGQVYPVLARARIFVMSSRHESFNIAAAEALCCGCSVVAPAHIATGPWFCATRSGTVAPVYSRTGLVDALSAEAAAWESGAREPDRIANHWRSVTGARAVAKRLVELVGGIG